MTRQPISIKMEKNTTMLFQMICIILDYINEKEDYFWKIADTFRDPIECGQ